MNWRAFIAEFIGTFALIFIGAGAGAIGQGGLVGVALAHGFVILTFAYCFGAISGAHFNPAVTLAMLVGKVISFSTAVSYIIAQVLGGVAGAAFLSLVLGGNASGLGTTTLSATVSPAEGVVLEAVLTFFLMNSICNAAVAGRAKEFAPFAIGLTLVFCILMGGPLTGASLNPARTLGPAIMTANFSNLWVYIVGPIVGAWAAMLFFKTVFSDSNSSHHG